MRANNYSLTAHVLITLAKSVRVTGVRKPALLYYEEV